MLLPLTSLRFFAAILVFLWHINILKNYQTGYIGVSFFFMLSGFILTYSYHTKFNSLNQRNLTNFYVARIAKIFPVHILTFILAIPFILHSGVNFKYLIIGILNLLLLQSYIPIKEYYFSFNGVSWSISVELFFYMLFPVLILALLRNKITSKILNLSLLMIAIWGTCIVFFGSYQAKLDDWLTYVFPFVRIVDFLIGICLGLIFLNIQKNPDKVNRKMRFATFTFLECLSIILLIGAIMYSPHINQSLRFSLYYQPFCLLLIYAFASQNGAISKLLSNKTLVYFGEISFSFYMIHGLVIRYLSALHVPYTHGIVGFLISLISSSIIYKYYEEPLRKKMRNSFTYYADNKDKITKDEPPKAKIKVSV